jgi:hypothetical protein
MTTMVALVGEQPLPNFLPVRHYHPSDILLVYTARTRQTYECLKISLQNETNVYGLETNPYDIALVARTINEKLDELAAVVSQPLMFNLTGGTKAMMLAAYQVAAQLNADVFYLQSEGVQSIIYRYRWHKDQLDLPLQEPLLKCINLCDVLDLHLGHRKWEEKSPNKNDVGGMFEWAIAQALHAHNYEVMCEVKNSAMDIDVMVRYQNQAGIIEAKAFDTQNSKDPNLESVGQLSKVGRHLGTYTKLFFVLNKQPSDTQKSVLEALRIIPISLLHYHQGMSTLTTEDTEILFREIDKSMGAGMANPNNTKGS